MKQPPITRFLGLDEACTDRAALGLGEGRLTRAAIDDGLGRRLARLARHPDGGSDAAETVRVRLREAASRLRREAVGPRPVPPRGHPGSPTPPTPPTRRTGPTRPAPDAVPLRREAPRLTPFDRMVMAVLAGSGGWNGRSRARLVALASMHGVSVQGLMKVVGGLAEYVRSGGPRPATGELSQGMSGIFAGPGDEPTPTRVGLAIERLQDAVAGELRGEGLWPRIRLSVLFGSLVLALGFVLVRVLLPGPTPPAENERRAAGSGGTIDPAPVVVRDADPSGDQPPSTTILQAKFPRPPTFQGEPRPEPALLALERSAALPGELEAIGRRVIVSDGRPSDAVLRQWRAVLEDAGACWPLLDPPRQRQVLDSISETLRPLEAATASDALLAALQPDLPESDEMWIWRSAFNAGVLAELVRRAAILPAAVVQRASTLLAGSLGLQAAGGLEGFDSGAAARLDAIGQELASRAGAHERFEDDWELWIEAQRAVRRGPPLQRAYAAVVDRLLREQADLSRPGQGSDLFGRFLQVLDFQGSSVVRDAVAAWFRDSEVNSNNLWVLTSLLSRNAGIRWFSTECLLSWDADAGERDRVLGAMLDRWPESAIAVESREPLVVIERSQLERWLEALQRVEVAATEAPSMDEVEAMRLLALVAEVNEAAACFLAGQFGSGFDLSTGVIESLGETEGGRQAERVRPPVGTASGPAGAWATAYAAAGRNQDQRLGLLRQLRLRPGGDLWPEDAAVLVKESLRGSPPELRSVARGVVVETFANGPNVVRELLDQLADAPVNAELAQTITRITGQTLPPTRSPEWMRRARLALARWILDLEPAAAAGYAIDVESDALAGSLRRRLVLAGAPPHEADGRTPSEAMGHLVDEWRRKAASLVVTDPVPAPLADLDRRRAVRARLADGVVSGFVGDQIGHLELAGFFLAAQQPWSAPAVRSELETSAVRRERSVHVLQQALEAELALARLWRLAFTAEEPTETNGVGDVRGRAGPRPTAPADDGAVGGGGASRDGSSGGARRPVGEPIAPPVENPDRYAPPRARPTRPRGGP